VGGGAGGGGVGASGGLLPSPRIFVPTHYRLHTARTLLPDREGLFDPQEQPSADPQTIARNDVALKAIFVMAHVRFSNILCSLPTGKQKKKIICRRYCSFMENECFATWTADPLPHDSERPEVTKDADFKECTAIFMDDDFTK